MPVEFGVIGVICTVGRTMAWRSYYWRRLTHENLPEYHPLLLLHHGLKFSSWSNWRFLAHELIYLDILDQVYPSNVYVHHCSTIRCMKKYNICDGISMASPGGWKNIPHHRNGFGTPRALFGYRSIMTIMCDLILLISMPINPAHNVCL